MCPVHIGGRPLIHGVYSSVNGGHLFSVITPRSLRRVVPPTHMVGIMFFFFNEYNFFNERALVPLRSHGHWISEILRPWH